MSDSREAQRQRNRERAPAIAKLMDEIREQFPGATLVWGIDHTTGVEFGTKPPEEKNVFTIPPNYFPCASLEELKAMREAQDKARGLRQQPKRRK